MMPTIRKKQNLEYICPDIYTLFLPEYTLYRFCPDIHSLNENDIEKRSSEHLFRAASKKFLRTGKSKHFRGGNYVDKYGKSIKGKLLLCLFR